MANITEMTHEERIELAFTQRQLEELERARSMPIVFAADGPVITPALAVKFRRVIPFRRANN